MDGQERVEGPSVEGRVSSVERRSGEDGNIDDEDEKDGVAVGGRVQNSGK
jgi:hypothetical protein